MKLSTKSKFFRNLLGKSDLLCEIAWKNRNLLGICLEKNRNFFNRIHDPPRFQTRLTPLSEIGRKSETEGNASLPQGGWSRWTPLAMLYEERVEGCDWADVCVIIFALQTSVLYGPYYTNYGTCPEDITQDAGGYHVESPKDLA